MIFNRHVKGKKVLIVTNETIAPLYLDRTIKALTGGEKEFQIDFVILPDGEQYKNMVHFLLTTRCFCNAAL